MSLAPTSAYRLSRDAEEEYARLMASPRSSTSALSDRTLVFSDSNETERTHKPDPPKIPASRTYHYEHDRAYGFRDCLPDPLNILSVVIWLVIATSVLSIMYLLSGIIALIVASSAFPYAAMCSGAGFRAALLGSAIIAPVLSALSFAAFTVKAWWTLTRHPDRVSSTSLQPHIADVTAPASKAALPAAAFAPAVGALVLSPKGATPVDALVVGLAGGAAFIVVACAFIGALKLARRVGLEKTLDRTVSDM